MLRAFHPDPHTSLTSNSYNHSSVQPHVDRLNGLPAGEYGIKVDSTAQATYPFIPFKPFSIRSLLCAKPRLGLKIGGKLFAVGGKLGCLEMGYVRSIEQANGPPMCGEDDVVMIDIPKYAKMRSMWVIWEGDGCYHGE